MSFIDPRTKFFRLVGLVDKVVSGNLPNIIDSMIEKDPKLLCRLNFKNKEVASQIIDRLKDGKIRLTDISETSLAA